MSYFTYARGYELQRGLHDSTVAVALWVLQDVEVGPTLELELDSVVEGGIGPIATNNPGWVSRL